MGRFTKSCRKIRTGITRNCMILMETMEREQKLRFGVPEEVQTSTSTK